mgnify:CR=1 FL=1
MNELQTTRKTKLPKLMKSQQINSIASYLSIRICNEKPYDGKGKRLNKW